VKGPNTNPHDFKQKGKEAMQATCDAFGMRMRNKDFLISAKERKKEK
jgi:hypothetical protein